jgi:Holliday junction resolvase
MSETLLRECLQEEGRAALRAPRSGVSAVTLTKRLAGV